MISDQLIKKYDVPSPRYTSYPTVPYWNGDHFDIEEWKERLKGSFRINNAGSGISIYIHLPFCEQLCTYCGCNKRITINHAVEDPYINCLLKEWKMYCEIFKESPLISEIHLGGGTPTFFSPENLKRLLDGILDGSIIHPDHQFSVEVHPNYTRYEHLKVLFDSGFRRLSVGIQDFDPKVQFLINRIQTFEKTAEVFEQARSIGYNSINADIIYGLPGQTDNSIALTIEQVKVLRPERIAFYSYAHVPWKSKSQRRYSEKDLPSAEIKRELYEGGKKKLLNAGYLELGMDHFVLPGDELHKAIEAKTLHRNFMGYTIQKSKLLVGLGVSSIGDTWNSFNQNVKEVEEYTKLVEEGRLPIVKGHLLDDEDLYIRNHILGLMCNLETNFNLKDLDNPAFTKALERLEDLKTDGLIEIEDWKIKVTSIGKAFLRNICLCFDAKFWHEEPQAPVFSKSI